MSGSKGEERTNVLILTDSRGVGIDLLAYQKAELRTVKFEFRIWRGASFKNFKDFLEEEPRQEYHLIIICGGICDFTRKETVTVGEVRLKTLTYKEHYNSVEIIISRLSSIRRLLRDKVIFATIPPASILKYVGTVNKSPVPEHMLATLQVDQDRLIQDIRLVNDWIISDSKEVRLPLIDWHRPVFPSKTKKRTASRTPKRLDKFVDIHLTDGVHPDEWLKAKWHNRALDIILPLLHNQLDTSTTQSESEDDSWNFKRRKTSGHEDDEDRPSQALRSIVVQVK